MEVGVTKVAVWLAAAVEAFFQNSTCTYVDGASH